MMSTFTIQNVKAAASRAKHVYVADSIEALNTVARAQKISEKYDIFLSHSFSDADLIYGVMTKLKDYGYSVYVDWVVDPHLDRKKITVENAKLLRARMNCCKSLLYTTTESSSNSKWMPWECGYIDGEKGKSAILPITQTKTNNYNGQEYLGIYPYITEDKSKAGKMRLYVNESSDIYCTFDDWLLGKKPEKKA